jgi:hypothetical protein
MYDFHVYMESINDLVGILIENSLLIKGVDSYE